MEPNSSSQNLLQVADSRLKSLTFWASLNWSLHNWFVALALIGSLVVPFGIAALPYLEKAHERPVNLALVVVSAISLVLQFLNLQLRLHQRAARCRRDRDRLQIAIADHTDGVISRDEFKKVVDEVLQSSAAEEAA